MLSRRHFVSAGVMALAMTASVAHAEDWKAKYKELTFAVVPAENASGVNDRYAPFISYLTKELGVPVKLRIANDYAAVIEGQRVMMVLLDSVGKFSRLGDAQRIRAWLEAQKHHSSGGKAVLLENGAAGAL